MDRTRFSSLLIELRKEKYLTQQDFAELFNVSFQAVSKWETGESIPDIATLEKISSFYGISINNLLKGNRTAPIDDKPRLEENIVEEEKKPNAEKSPKTEINIFKVIFSSCALGIFFLLGLLPFVRGHFIYNLYVTSNYYGIIFSSNMLVGNFMYLLDFFVFITTCVLGILAGVFPKEKVLYKLELTFALYHAIFLVAFNLFFLGYASVGLYVMTLYGLVYFFVTLFVKPAKIDTSQDSGSMKLWLRSTFVAFMSLFTIFWLSTGQTMSVGVIGFLAIIIGPIALLTFHIISFFKKSKVFNVLVYVFFAVTLIGYLICFALGAATDVSLLYTALLVALEFLICEIVMHNIEIKSLKEATN